MRAHELIESADDYVTKIAPRNAWDKEGKQELIKSIQNQCKQYLGMIGNSRTDVLYRGIKLWQTGPLAMTMPGTREGRQPTDNPAEFHNKVTQIIRNNPKLIANRDNSWFATGQRTEAQQYGTVYVALPTSPFSYTWNPMIADLYTRYDSANDDTTQDQLEADLEEYRGNDSSLKWAIESGNEIMIMSPAVILVHYEYYPEIAGELKT